jgi:hypothetical protein
MVKHFPKASATVGAIAIAWLVGATAFAQLLKLERPGVAHFSIEPLTSFEKSLFDRIRDSGAIYQDDALPPADNNARGLILQRGSAAILNMSVWGRKYGLSLDGTGDVLIKNFSFTYRRSKDQYGAGLVLGGKAATRGETWVSNAFIDLKGNGPIADYRQANNEAISVERGNNFVNVRQSVLLGGEESGLDNKGDVRMDAVFIASGHRPVRIWTGASLEISNSIVLAFPGFGGFWFGGGEGQARLDYYNCRFGRVGDRIEDLTDTIPDWMINPEADDPVDIRIRKLSRDPFDRSSRSFWTPVATPIPPGYLDKR